MVPSTSSSIGGSSNALAPVAGSFTTVMTSNSTSWDTAGVGSPFVFYDAAAGLYKMWYTAQSEPTHFGPYTLCRYVIAYAQSKDGVNWVNKTVLVDTGGPSFYQTGDPWVLKENGTYLMWHMDYYDWVAGDWSNYIARMSSPDGVSWPAFMSAGDMKVLDALGQTAPQGDGYCVEGPCVLNQSSGYVMWYSVRDHPRQGVGGPAKIWVATSTDGISWSNRQLSLPYINGTWEGGVSYPSVVREDDGTYTMFYAAQSANGSTSIGVANSLDGVTWMNRTQFLKPSDLGANVTSIGTPFQFQDASGRRYLYFEYYDGKPKLGRIRLAPSAPSPIDWWPMFHHDPSHTGYSSSTAPKTNQTLWTYGTGNNVFSSPAIAGGVVYVGSLSLLSAGGVYALNATTGKSKWYYALPPAAGVGGGASSPAVSGGVVYVAIWIGGLLALNASTGALKWGDVMGLVISSPAVAGGVVYVGSYDHRVYALDASTGALKWNYTTGSYVESSPAVANGVDKSIDLAVR